MAFAPEIFDPLDGTIYPVLNWSSSDDRTHIPLKLEPNASFFLVFREKNQPEGMQER